MIKGDEEMDQNDMEHKKEPNKNVEHSQHMNNPQSQYQGLHVNNPQGQYQGQYMNNPQGQYQGQYMNNPQGQYQGQHMNNPQGQYQGQHMNNPQGQYQGQHMNNPQGQYQGQYMNNPQGQYYTQNTNNQQNQYRTQNQYNVRKFNRLPIQYNEGCGREGKGILNDVGFALFIFILAILGSQTVIEVLTYLLVPSVAETNWYIWVVTAITIVGIGFPIYYFLMKRIPNTPRKEVIKLRPKEFITLFFICAAFMYVTNILSTILTVMIAFLKGDTELLNPAAEAILNSNFIVSLIYASIVAPIIEELIFRKILLDKLRRFGDIPAILMTGIAFGLFHMNLSQFFYASVLGFIFAYITIKTNTVKYAIILHMMINFISTAISPIVLNENLLGIVLINIWMYGSITVGTILFFINMKKIKFEKAALPVKKSYFILNTGTILYILVCLVMITLVTVY